MTGGCQCRRVRYAVIVTDDEASLCHCGMCRRATGGVAAALKTVAVADVTWTAAPPDIYRSSPIAERPYCAACGSPLGFRFLDSEEMELTVGSFDDPVALPPDHQFLGGDRACRRGWTSRICRAGGWPIMHPSQTDGRRPLASSPTEPRVRRFASFDGERDGISRSRPRGRPADRADPRLLLDRRGQLDPLRPRREDRGDRAAA